MFRVDRHGALDSRDGTRAPPASGTSSAPQSLGDAAMIAVHRAEHLRRVLLALPQPEPLPRIAGVFANPRPLRELMGAASLMEDQLAAALARGHCSVRKSDANDRVTGRLVKILSDAGAARYVPRPSTTDTVAYSVPAIEAALAFEDCQCVLPAARAALHKAFVEAGRRHLGYVHRLRIRARDLFLACERGEYARAAMMVMGKLAARKTSVSSVGSTGGADTALSSLGAQKASLGVSRAPSMVSSLGAAGPSDRAAFFLTEAASGASHGLGAIQVRGSTVLVCLTRTDNLAACASPPALSAA